MKIRLHLVEHLRKEINTSTGTSAFCLISFCMPRICCTNRFRTHPGHFLLKPRVAIATITHNSIRLLSRTIHSSHQQPVFILSFRPFPLPIACQTPLTSLTSAMAKRALVKALYSLTFLTRLCHPEPRGSPVMVASITV